MVPLTKVRGTSKTPSRAERGRAPIHPDSEETGSLWPMNVGEGDAEKGLEGCCKASG